MKFALTLVCALSLACAVAQANPIFVTNFSFETLPPGGLTNDSCGTGCFYSNSGSIPGWAVNSASAGQFQPGTQTGNVQWFTTLDDGITSAYSNGGPISQTVAATVQQSVVYTLLVDLGRRNDQLFTASADLLINGNRYNAVGVAPTPGNWSTFTATYTGLAADAGKQITIELNSSGAQANFDDVRLSDNSTSTPEPATFTALALGLVGILAKVRRRR